MRALSLAALTAVLLFPSLPAPGQSLADAAAKEKERRKAAKGKTYTEADLGKATGGNYNAPAGSTSPSDTAAAPAAPAAAGAPGSAEAPKEKTPDEVRAEQEKAWRQRLQQASDDMAKAQQQIDTLERTLGDITGNLYGASRTQQMTQMEQAQKQLATARQQRADLEEEGRRNGWR